jgi:hypothetical protein
MWTSPMDIIAIVHRRWPLANARGCDGRVRQELATAIKALGAYLSGKLSGLTFQKMLSAGRSGRI